MNKNAKTGKPDSMQEMNIDKRTNKHSNKHNFSSKFNRERCTY